MGWDGLDLVDGIVHIRVIPVFVWFVGLEEWDEI
jgi:hypothetical protein